MAQPPLGSQANHPGLVLQGQAYGVTIGLYPPAKATHQQVTNDRQLFMRLLRKLHEELGTTFRTPTVSAKELDLHLLYIQVTNHGGLEAVVSGKKWTEVSQPFKFPPSFTSKSFTLRKMYSRLLHDFEQVYFFRNTGPPIVPYGADGTKIEGGAAMSSTNGAYRRRRAEVPTQLAPLTHPFPGAQIPQPMFTGFLQGGQPFQQGSYVGQSVQGRVEAQFDCGMFITLTVGQQEYLGVLYIPPQHLLGNLSPLGSGGGLRLDRQGQPMQLAQPPLTQAHAPVPPPGPLGPQNFQPPSYGFYAASPEAPGTGQSFYGYPATPLAPPAKRPKLIRDPNQPKQNKTPFNFFSIDAREKAKQTYPGYSQKEISKVVGEWWSKTSDEEKEKYVKMAAEDKERYHKALTAYNMKRETSLEQQQAWAQGQSVGGVAPLVMARAGHEEGLQSSQSMPMIGHPMATQQLPPPPPQITSHALPPTPPIHTGYSGPAHQSLPYTAVPQQYQQRQQQRFGGLQGGNGESHEDAALSMQEMLQQENEVAGQLVNLRDHHQFAPMHQHQLRHQQTESSPYTLGRTHMQMPMLQPGHQMQASHGAMQRGPHGLPDVSYEPGDVEQEEYEDEGSDHE
eukprot:jgi/Botrbrau1/21322/Bobra.0184s0032.1